MYTYMHMPVNEPLQTETCLKDEAKGCFVEEKESCECEQLVKSSYKMNHLSEK